MLLSVVIPDYNERKTIGEVVRRIEALDQDKEIIIADDCSTDGTRDLLKSYEKLDGFKIIYLPRNKGKGSAVRAAFERVEGEIIVIQDADLEYDPKDIPLILEPIIDGRADVVYGSRVARGTHSALFFLAFVANRLLTILNNILHGLNLTDMETGYKAFRKTVLDSLTFKCDCFGWDVEFTGKVARKKFRIFEVPISYSGRDYSEGKKINWKDGVAAIWFIFRFRFFD